MEESSHESLVERLRQAEDALERCQRLSLASQYASAVMHEVNNPLEAITNLIYLTKLDRNDPDQVYAHAEFIEEQLKILGSVTRQALTYHRPQAEAKEFDLIHIAEAALKLHTDKFVRHGVTVERRFCGPATATMQGSEILQVLSNLLLNAVDVLDRGHGRISVRVGSNAHMVHLMVSDNGPGVSQEIVPRMFAPYATSKKHGTGLGLWLSKRIVEKHGGTLRFRTSRGSKSGTCFRLSLPRIATA